MGVFWKYHFHHQKIASILRPPPCAHSGAGRCADCIACVGQHAAELHLGRDRTVDVTKCDRGRVRGVRRVSGKAPSPGAPYLPSILPAGTAVARKGRVSFAGRG